MIITALIWGITNPFIKLSSSKALTIQEEKEETINPSRLSQASNLFLKNYAFILLQLLNRSGAYFYFLALQSSPLSITSGVTNGLTLVITELVECFLFSKKTSFIAFFGILCILYGSYLCSSVNV